MSYREHVPPSGLEPWLACTWERWADDATPARILPDGCIDIVFIEGAGAHVVGPNTTAFLVSLPVGTWALGARFRPGAAPALLSVGAEELRDGRLPLGSALGDRGARLEDALHGGGDGLGLLERALAERAASAPPPDPLVRAVVDRLGRPRASVAGIARELAVSERQLRRRISQHVGYGPKRLARVLRLLAALEAARCGDELARVAFEAGYADQSHFTNECSELAGAPPAVLLGSDASDSSKTPGRATAMIPA